MPNFYGSQSVIASYRKHLLTGKVTSGTLKSRTNNDTFTSTAYAAAYVYPVTRESGLGGNGAPIQNTQIVLWQMGESVAPAQDYEFVDSDSRTWIIESVNTRLNATANYAVHDLTVARFV